MLIGRFGPSSAWPARADAESSGFRAKYDYPASVHETDADLADLQRLLDGSIDGSGDHLRSIITPGQRTLTARQLTAVLTGMQHLAVATVTAKGEPRISAVDGHFLRARWVFTTSGTAVKARHLRARPALSVCHIRGDDLGVFAHGDAEFLAENHPDFGWIEDHLVRHYGSSPRSWGPEIVYIRVQPRWMVGYAFRPEAVVPPN